MQIRSVQRWIVVNLYQVNLADKNYVSQKFWVRIGPKTHAVWDVEDKVKLKPYTIYVQKAGAGDQALLRLTHTITHQLAHLQSAATAPSAGSLPSVHATPGPGVFSSATASPAITHIIKAGGLEVTRINAGSSLLSWLLDPLCQFQFLLLTSPISCTSFLPRCLPTDFRLQRQTKKQQPLIRL